VPQTRQWLDGVLKDQGPNQLLGLGIGGPRESEAPGIYQQAVEFLRAVLRGGQ